MKALVIIIKLLLIVNFTTAQWSNKFLGSKQEHYLYANGGLVAGDVKGGELGISFVYKKKYSIQFGYSATEKTTVSPPSDFLKSAGEQISPMSGNSFENMENFHVTVGRIIELSKRKKLRLNIQGGGGISNVREPSDWYWCASDDYGLNYNCETAKKQELSIVINPKFEFPLSPMIGVTFGPTAILAKEKSFYGFGAGIIYGCVWQ